MNRAPCQNQGFSERLSDSPDECGTALVFSEFSSRVWVFDIKVQLWQGNRTNWRQPHNPFPLLSPLFKLCLQALEWSPPPSVAGTPPHVPLFAVLCSALWFMGTSHLMLKCLSTQILLDVYSLSKTCGFYTQMSVNKMNACFSILLWTWRKLLSDPKLSRTSGF